MVADFNKMTGTKYVLGFAGAILLFFASWFAYEYYAYRCYSKLLDNYGSRVVMGTPRQDVLRAIGTPNSTVDMVGGKTMSWSAGSRQGKLTEFVGLSTVKGHFELAITFDANDRVVEVYEGVN
jgi:hypothetical protein